MEAQFSTTLVSLGRAIEAEKIQGDAVISGVAYDSRRVKPGDLFCAVPGFRTNGHRYIDQAMGRGAVACLVEDLTAVPQGFPALVVPHSRSATAKVAAEFYGHPSRELWMVGVTGTNGKTTTTHLVRTLLEYHHVKMGLTGTVHTLIGDETYPVERTTPEAPDLQAALRLMVDRGMQGAVMEVSSHALTLNRVDGVAYDVGVFTNLTQDHLDFHQDFEDYFGAKARLFQALGQSRLIKGPQAAVLNADDPWAGRLVGQTAAPILTYGMHPSSDVRALDIELDGQGSRFTVILPDETRARVSMGLSGRFNVSNALAAMAVAYLKGMPVEEMAAALAVAPGVPGRFERVAGGQPFTVIVDYAHSPDGLENVLKTAREFVQGRLVVVFGAGGDRDHGKRPLMGEVAGRIADLSIITSDNPRSEEPEAILRQVEQGVKGAGGQYVLEVDRGSAIRRAVGMAQPGDVIVIAGKGHENYQIFRDRTIHFDDREQVRLALGELGYSCR